MIWLVGGFFVTALLYAAVGFGGGSTYSALMALAGVDYRILPLISLACNIVVVAGSTLRFARAGVTPWRGAILLTALAAPAAMLGGLTPIDKASFLTLLGGSLLLTGITLLLPVAKALDDQPAWFARWMPFVAAPIGYLAGLVGIGGGISGAPAASDTLEQCPRNCSDGQPVHSGQFDLRDCRPIAEGRYRAF